MKLTKEKLYQLILEQWSEEDLEALKDKKPGYAFTTPRRKFSDEPLKDQWGRPIYQRDEEGYETLDYEYPELDATPELLRARAAQMARGGVEPKNVRKLSKLGSSNIQDFQTFEIADQFMDEPLEGRYNPQLEKTVSSHKKVKLAFNKIRHSSEFSNYMSELSRLQWHDGSMDYEDNFNEADEELRSYEAYVAREFGLSDKEIDLLDSMLEGPKEAY